MQKDFHYYTVYSLLLDSGYSKEDAEVIAYASQYVDDCNENQLFKNDPTTVFKNEVHVGDQLFRGIITQTCSLKTFSDETQNYVLIPFHFLPGNNPAITFGTL